MIHSILKLPLLVFLFVSVYVSTVNAKDNVKADWTMFSLKDQLKAEQLDATVMYPSHWQATQGMHPHIVQMFNDPTDKLVKRNCGILVNAELPEADPDEWREMFEDPETDFHEYMENGGILLLARPTTYDGQPGVLLEYLKEVNRAGIPMITYTQAHNVVYKNYWLTLSCSVLGPQAQKQEIKSVFNSSRKLFLQFGNSLIINDKWNNIIDKNNIDANPATPDDNSTIEIVFVLFLSILYTWGIGLFIPWLIRYRIVKRPIKDPAAWGIAIIQGIAMIMVSILLGGSGKHTALILVTLVSHVILKRSNGKIVKHKNDK